MEIRDFLRFFIENEQSVINSLKRDVIDWMLTVQLLDNFGNTPLHNLAQNGNLEAIKNIFYSNKRNIKKIYMHYNVLNMHGMNPLHVAIFANQLDVVKFFCETDIEKIFIKPLGGWSLLDLAIIKNNSQLASILIENANIDLTKSQLLNLPPILAATLMDAYDVAHILLEKGADIKILEPRDSSNILLLSLHEPINVAWVTNLLPHSNLLYQRNKKGLAAADAYFQPTKFHIGWAKGGKTHNTIRKLIRSNTSIVRLLWHHLLSLLIQHLQKTMQYWRDAFNEFKNLLIRLKNKILWHTQKASKYTELAAAFSYAHECDSIRKAYAHEKQLTKLYLSSNLALADNTSTDQGKMIYGVMTQRILESRGMMPVSDTTQNKSEQTEALTAPAAEEPREVTFDEMNAGIPENLLPAAYKKNPSQNNS